MASHQLIKMTDIKILIRKKIKAIRKKSGLTQEKLGELIGIEPQSMSYMENGKFALLLYLLSFVKLNFMPKIPQ